MLFQLVVGILTVFPMEELPVLREPIGAKLLSRAQPQGLCQGSTPL